ncbi:hypothetical protein GCM10022631_11440 [Deinococcus rubellus]|uniref:hypothetical protein n=1 Tax=Deinococcus rubellus TaxID=1889240 RepID=UPI0031E99AD6
MRYTFARPGGTPYLTVYTREAQYAAAEIAPLGGTFETLRGEFCGQASLKFSAPPPFLAGDWLRVYLDGDAEDDPTYLGEMTGEPWEAGGGTVNCRPLAATVGKARWSGTIQASFALYLGYVIGHCVLPPGVSIGSIPMDLAVLKANTLFELLSDTMEAARPVIENGSWGVDNKARLGMYRPDDTVNYRFVLGEAETPPGSSSDYANSVRFPYKNPDGTDAWFEGQIASEVAARGEAWEVATAPARVTEAADNPLDGFTGTVDIATKYSGYAIDVSTGQSVYFEHPGPYVARSSGLFFNADFAGALATPGMFIIHAGQFMHPATVDESVMTVTLPNTSSSYSLDLIVDNHGLPLSQVLEVRKSPSTEWVAANQTVNNGALKQIEVFGGYTTDIRYNPSFFATYAPSGLGVTVNGSPRSALSTGTAASIKSHVIVTCRNDAGQFFTVPVDMYPFVGNPNSNFSSTQWAQGGSAQNLSPAASALVTPPAPVFLTAGSAVLTYFNTLVTGGGSGATGVSLVTPGGDVALTRGTTTDNVTRWTYAGDGVSVSAFKLTGDPTRIGRILPQLSSTATLTAYAYGLLRYRVPPVRVWTGLIRELRRVPCSGVALFEVAGGDVPLDVQRCVYGDGTVKVECGTPVASTDQAALAGRIESLQRQIRTLGGS